MIGGLVLPFLLASGFPASGFAFSSAFWLLASGFVPPLHYNKFFTNEEIADA
jgi:hypothetical protein